MSTESKKEIQLEIAHVLFIDIIGYSKLSINAQHAAVEEQNRIIRGSEQFQRADAASRLLKISTGDGMALVFYTTPEALVQCAVEIGRALNGNNPHGSVITFPPAQPPAVYHTPSHRVAGRAVSFWLAHDRGNRYTVRMIASLSVHAQRTSGLYAMIPQSLVEKFRPCLVWRQWGRSSWRSP